MANSSKWKVRESKWHLAIDDPVLQSQPYNPSVEGPNPDQPPDTDNAQNSREQEVALQAWVNMAIDLMNRGHSVEMVQAKLAHDGCPNPTGVIQRAIEQPQSPLPEEMQTPVSPGGAPAPENANPAGGMATTIPTQPTASTKISDVWGNEGVIVDEPEPEVDPMDQINALLDSVEPVTRTTESLLAHVAKLKQIRVACRRTIRQPNLSYDRMQAVDEIAEHAQLGLLNATATLEKLAEEENQPYVDSQPQFGIEVVPSASTTKGNLDLGEQIGEMVDEAQTTDYEGMIDEQPELVVSELAYRDPETVTAAATRYITPRLAGLTSERRKDYTERFVQAALKIAEEWPEEQPEQEPEAVDADGPAEGLFV